MIFVALQNCRTKKVFPLLFGCCCWIRDPISGIRDGQKSGSWINIPDPQHWSLHITVFLSYTAGCVRNFLVEVDMKTVLVVKVIKCSIFQDRKRRQ